MNLNGKIFTKTLPANGEDVVIILLTWESEDKTYYQIVEGTYKYNSVNKFSQIYCPISMKKTEIDKKTISNIIQGDIQNLKQRIEFSDRAENYKFLSNFDYLFDNKKYPWYEDNIENLYKYYDIYKEIFDLVEEKSSCKEIKDFIRMFKNIKGSIKNDN